MKRWIEFNLKHPKTILALLLLISIISVWGVTQVQFDSSTEVLMPREDVLYKLGQRAKIAFGDSKTFMVTSIEAKQGELFSNNVFQKILALTKELEEYKDFDKVKEDLRIQTLLNLSQVSIFQKQQKVKKKKTVNKSNSKLKSISSLEEDLDAQMLGSDSKQKESTKKNTSEIKKKNIKNKSSKIEDDLDAEILGNSSGSKKKAKKAQLSNLEKDLDAEILGGAGKTKKTESAKNTKDDFWNLDKELESNNYVKAIRDRNKYDYSNYKAVSFKQIENSLDEVAKNELQTIILSKKIELADKNSILTKSQFKSILEGWEDLYLFKSMEIVKTLIDPVTAEDIQGTKTELKPVDLIAEDDNGNRILPKTKKDFIEYKTKLLNNPMFDSYLYGKGEDGKIIALALSMTLELQKKHDVITNYLWNAINKYNDRGLRIYVMGNLIFNKFMNDFNKKDLSRYLPLTILVVIFTFFLNFRSLRGLLLPTVTVILGTLWTIGLMGVFGIYLTIIGSVLPPLLIAVGSSYSIHIFNQYLIDLKSLHQSEQEGKKLQGLLSSMTHISTTVALAGFTTFIGFLTLTVNQVTGLRDFGIFAAIGTLFSVAVSVMLISSMLLLLKNLPLKKLSAESNSNDEEGHKSNYLVSQIVSFLSFVSIRFHRVIVIGVFLSIVIGIMGLSKIKTETTPSNFFKPGSYVRKSINQISHVLNGSMILNVVIDSGKKGGAKDPAFLKFIERFQKWTERPEQKSDYRILKSHSFADFIKRMHKAMHEDKDEFYVIPNNRSDVEDYLTIFSGKDDDADGRPDSFESTIDTQYRHINVGVRLGDVKGKPAFGTGDVAKAWKHIEKYLSKQKNPGHYSWKIVGTPVNYVVLGKYIVKGQILSILLSTIIVALVIFLLFRNVQAGFIALIPISFTIILIFGAMGFFNIPLDMAKAIISSIAIGIGVDDTIHFLNTLRKEQNKGLSLVESIREAHKDSGMAIVYTSLALIFGFSVLTLSSFTPIFFFGLLVSSVMVITTIGALVVIPAFILTFKLELNKEKKWKIFRVLNLKKFLPDE